MHKLITIIVICVVVLGLGLFLLKVFTSSPPSNTPTPLSGTPNSFPSSNPTPSPTPNSGSSQTGATLSVANAAGGTMQVQDFRHNNDVVPDPANNGYYYLGNHYGSDPAATANPPYVVEYIGSTGYFNIAITQEPLKQTRLTMEAYLQNVLGLSQSQMCNLNYMVSAPSWVNQIYAGKNLGFSFCPGAVQLP